MKNLEKDMRVWVQLGKSREAGILLDWAFSPEGDYYGCKVELLKVNPFASDQLLRQVYPRPIQSYKLTKRVEVLPGEEVHGASTV